MFNVFNMRYYIYFFALSVAYGEEHQCQLLAAKFALEDLNTLVDTSHKQLVGTWLSEVCEVRPGPHYLLRSYTFREDGTYKITQYHYWDSSCSSPKLTISSVGLLRLIRNVYSPEAATGAIRPINITLTAQDSDAARDLDKTVSENCPDVHWHQWIKYEEYLLYDTMVDNLNASSLRKMSENDFLDISCLGSLKWTLREFKYIKIQIRPIYNNISDTPVARFHRFELLMADTSSGVENSNNYAVSSFHTPLIKWAQDHTTISHNKYYKIKNVCSICSNLHKSITPPHLLKKPDLPPYIWGNWISTRCEIKSLGFYLTRRFSFESNAWIGEYKFYLDPNCAVPKFSVTAAGDVELLGKNAFVESATNVNFNIRRASITIFDRKMSEEMSNSNACRVKMWELYTPYELSHNHGCSEFNLLIPSTQYQIVKLDINYEGSSLLYMGLTDASVFSKKKQKRPTSYQEPLLKCSFAVGLGNYWDGALLNERYFDSLNSSETNKQNRFLLILEIYLFILLIL